MNRRVIGSFLALLVVGGGAGYAWAAATPAEPVEADGPEPVPAVSPAVPTPPEFAVLPDPTAAALQPGLPSHEEELRMTRRGAGASVLVPVGWLQNREPDSQTWTFVPPINTRNTYGLRVKLMIGQQLAVPVAKAARLAALQSAEEDGNIEGLEITAETDDSFEARYIDEGYLRVTMERWVGDENNTAYADIAVTGRVVDQEGLRDLLVRTVESATYLEPLPPRQER